MTVTEDLTTTLKGAAGISVFTSSPTVFSTFDAGDRTIDLTISPVNGDDGGISKAGLGVTNGSKAMVGDFRLTMHGLPVGTGFGSLEHYGVVVGSTVNAGETKDFDGLYSKAEFGNLTIDMQSSARGGLLPNNPLLAGIRAIQGAGGRDSAGHGSSGYVSVSGNLDMDIVGAANDVIGIYVSGGDSQVHLNNSDIAITSTSDRANAIRLGKTSTVGSGVGKLYSTGVMVIDTTAAPNSGAIDVIWQGALLDADADTSSTTINAGGAAIRVEHLRSNPLLSPVVSPAAQTQLLFNNLVASTQSEDFDLIEVGTNQNDVVLRVRGSDSDLTAAPQSYIIDIAGDSDTASHVKMTLSEGAMTGLTNKTDASSLDLTLDQGALWTLAKGGKGNTQEVANFTDLHLDDAGTVVDATADAANFVLRGNVDHADQSEIRLFDGAGDDILTIDGNYVVADGLVTFDTVLGDDTSMTDLLVINGTTSGSGLVRVTNAGGAGAQTVEGIRIIDVVNGDTDANQAQFALLGDYVHEGAQAVVGGAYAYKLYQGGTSTPTDGDWYLRSELIDTTPLYQAATPIYEVYPQHLLALNGLPTLQQRVGNRFWSGEGATLDAEGAETVAEGASPSEWDHFTENRGLWGRLEGLHANLNPEISTSDVSYEQDVQRMQAGIDFLADRNEDGEWIGGLTAHYAHGWSDIVSPHGLGEIDTSGFGLGGTLTWYGNDGFYLDAQGQATWYDSTLVSSTANQVLADGNNGFGYALSVETGKRIELDERMTLTPQAQLIYSRVMFDSFTDPLSGLDVGLRDGDSLRGRLGIALDHETSWTADDGTLSRSHLYGVANLHYEFLNGTQVELAGVDFDNRNERLWGEVGIGGSYNWNDDKFSLHGEGAVSTALSDFGDNYALKGTIGFRAKW